MQQRKRYNSYSYRNIEIYVFLHIIITANMGYIWRPFRDCLPTSFCDKPCIKDGYHYCMEKAFKEMKCQCLCNILHRVFFYGRARFVR